MKMGPDNEAENFVVRPTVGAARRWRSGSISMRLDFVVEPGAGEGPLAAGRRLRDTKRIRSFGDGHANEVTKSYSPIDQRQQFTRSLGVALYGFENVGDIAQ